MSGDTKLSCPELNSEDAITWAVANNLRVVLPTEYQLLIDIDNPYDRGVFTTNFDIVDSVYGIDQVTETTSRSGKSGNSHIVVTLKTPLKSVLERIALQAVLGSDRRREAHSLRRSFQGEQNPTLFFEKRWSLLEPE